ncbi:MAG TPA: GMC oxidoreductase [Verrucomicrobiae bacterium]|jgi:choline dehydrogenase-like flavoprotein|nr:GMC oxidoreductase [Verrucomicrobiae bacterium]
MASANVIIVGSGAAGVAAAYALRGRGVLLLDVGARPPASALKNNFYELRRDPGPVDLFGELIGNSFESLHNIFHPYLSPKLKAPGMKFVLEGAERLAPLESRSFEAAISFAAGGLANAWGAGLYRATDKDLKGFPIGARDLDPYYDVLTEKIGISGDDDDLGRYFGAARGLLPAMKIDANGAALLGRYDKRRRALNRAGLYIGRPRLAVLTRAHDGRPAYGYEGLEFFRGDNPAIYTPALTLKEMIARGEIAYAPGLLVERYNESGDEVRVLARESAGGARRDFTARRLILAAGALNTAKIALNSNDDCDTRLPLLDNAVSYIPLIDPRRIGAAFEKEFFAAATLNAVYDGPLWPEPVQMTLYGAAGTLRSDFLFDFPLAARDALAAAKYLTPALVIAQLFYPDAPAATNYLRLAPSGKLELAYEPKRRGALEARLVKLFRRLGCFGLARFCKHLAPGSSFHYAGGLPMKSAPRTGYETDRSGRLAGARAVYIADAANFPALPSKNHSFTMMANAMRIAAEVGRTLP